MKTEVRLFVRNRNTLHLTLNDGTAIDIPTGTLGEVMLEVELHGANFGGLRVWGNDLEIEVVDRVADLEIEIANLEDMLYGMSGLTDWLAAGYTVGEYDALVERVEARSTNHAVD